VFTDRCDAKRAEDLPVEGGVGRQNRCVDDRFEVTRETDESMR
jgi:hypothetical protein